LTARAVERRFGARFAARLAELPAGEWVGPVGSRYGEHLVFVHGRRPGEIPELDAVREKVKAAVRQSTAQRWLGERLRQLRSEVEVVVVEGEGLES
jgi:parvulin-like peptidyl-prolyl isomerase